MRVLPINEDRIARLRDFGLSEYAARAYLALLDLGLTEARDVSALSKVPTSKIYHVLDQLHDKGLVMVLPEFPKKYAPVPFGEYLDKLQRDHEEAALGIERDREELTSLFSVTGEVTGAERGGFTVIRGRRNVLSKINELVASATTDLFALGSRGMTLRIDSFADALRGAEANGTRIRLLLSVEEEGAEALAPVEAFADVRVRSLEDWMEATHVAIAVADNLQAIIVHFSPDDGNPYQGKDVAIFTDHPPMVATMRALLEPYWSRAPTLAARRGEAEEGRVPEATRFYGTQGEAHAALEEALARGARECRYVNPHPVDGLSTLGRGLMERVLATVERARLLLNVHSAEFAAEVQRLMSAHSNLEVRHVEAPVVARYAALDEREAFISLVRPPVIAGFTEGVDAATARDLIVHTSHALSVKSVVATFEEAWAGARPLALRANELSGARSADSADDAVSLTPRPGGNLRKPS